MLLLYLYSRDCQYWKKTALNLRGSHFPRFDSMSSHGILSGRQLEQGLPDTARSHLTRLALQCLHATRVGMATDSITYSRRRRTSRP